MKREKDKPNLPVRAGRDVGFGPVLILTSQAEVFGNDLPKRVIAP